MDRSNTRCPFVLCITVEYLLSHWCKLQRHITICSCNIFIYSKKTVIAIKDLFLQSRFPSYQYHAGIYFIMTSTTSSRNIATYIYYLLFWRVLATSRFLLHVPQRYSHIPPTSTTTLLPYSSYMYRTPIFLLHLPLPYSHIPPTCTVLPYSSYMYHYHTPIAAMSLYKLFSLCNWTFSSSIVFSMSFIQ